MAKSKTPKEPEAEEPIPTSGPLIDYWPEVWGFALEPREGKFLACRISTRGKVEYLGPKKNGEPRPESKPAALGRMYEAIKNAYAPPTSLRFS